MPQPNNRSGQLLRTLPGSVRALEEGQYEISFASETPYDRWFGPEILLCEEGAVDLSRMGDNAALLFAHGRDPRIGPMPIGKIVRAWVDPAEHKCRAVVEFDGADEDAQKIRRKVDGGMLSGVSVGYSVSSWESVGPGKTSANGRFAGPCEVAVKWLPYEISFEPTPADPTVGLGKSINEEDNQMPNPISTPAPEAEGARSAAPEAAAPQTAAPEASLAAERQRCSDITALCRRFGQDPAPYIDGGDSLDQVRAAILDGMASARTGVTGIQVTADEGDKFRRAAVDGLLIRAGIAVERPAEGSRTFAGLSLRDIAAESLRMAGESAATRMSNDELLRRAMSPDSAFVAIAGEVAQAAMAAGYQAAPTTYQLWTGRGTAKDFKPTAIYQISEAGTPVRIPQNGEFTFDEMATQQQAVRQLYTYGRSFGLTRQAFVNDDLDVLTKIPRAYAAACRRGINRAVYQILKNNPAMLDGQQLFSAAHKNLGAAAKPGTPAFTEAIALMRRQKNLRGDEPLNLVPGFVLTPAAIEVPIRQMVTSTVDPDAKVTGVPNVFNNMQAICDAELDVDSGAAPFYFAAAPGLCDTIEVSYLNGNDQPTLEMRPSWERLGIEYRIYMDYGVSLVDYRGLVKNPGLE
jgi:hypothetical protein|nr:MAG TPA: major capsid protein [Caudoviricetes sp.]